MLSLRLLLPVCRIVRVIRQPRGNMLLIGVGGSGRQSLSRMASYIISYNVFQIEVTRHYRVQEFREGGFCDHYSEKHKETCPCDVTQRGNGAWDSSYLHIPSCFALAEAVPLRWRPCLPHSFVNYKKINYWMRVSQS